MIAKTNLQTIEYEIRCMRKMVERRALFLEITFCKVIHKIDSLEKEIRKMRENIEEFGEPWPT